jgi:hypothetical protein
MDIPESSKIVYLDQNAWIELSRFREGKKSSCDKRLFETILQASNSGTAFFPMSLIHLSEITNTAKAEWRKELLSLMLEVSHYYTFTPHWDKLRELEIKNLVLKELSRPLIDVRSYLVGKGFSNLMGATPTVNSEEISPEMLKEINQKLLLALNDPEIFLTLVHKVYRDSKREMVATVKEFENLRKELSQFKDNQYRRKVFLWRNIIATILPKLNLFLSEMNLSLTLGKKITENILDKYNADDLLSKIPTALCELNLMFQRDQQSSRPIQVNDIYDIWHLELAIPYSNIVVTEVMWTTIAKNAKLDEKCNTVILSSINDLIEYL